MARGLNKIMIIGNLGRDPEMRFTPSGKSVTNFSVACNRSWKSADGERHLETEWFNVVAWGYLAESAKQFLTKGCLVYVEGRLQSRTWQDNQGNQHKSVEIIANDMQLLSDNDNGNEMNNSEEIEKYPF
ncbi:MAG: single-stranded DNA-binding protein [Anaerolineales bacterium]|jgi:single-strand DNA-binding protein